VPRVRGAPVREVKAAAAVATALVLAAGAWLVRAGTAPTTPPRPLTTPSVDGVPGWRPGPDPPAFVLAPDPRADGSLLRTYLDGRRSVWLALDYYPDQQPEARPAARHLVFAGRGWTELRERRHAVTLREPPGATLRTTLVEMRRGDERYVLLYWYQAGPASTGDDHWYRLLALYYRLVHGRPDGALVRVATPVDDGGEAAALARLEAFVNAFYPELLRAMSLAGGTLR